MAEKNKISIKTQLKHIYSEDRRRAYQHLADSIGCMRELLPVKKLKAHRASVSARPNLIGRMPRNEEKQTRKSIQQKKKNDFHVAILIKKCSKRSLHNGLMRELMCLLMYRKKYPDIMLLPENFRPPPIN